VVFVIYTFRAERFVSGAQSHAGNDDVVGAEEFKVPLAVRIAADGVKCNSGGLVDFSGPSIKPTIISSHSYYCCYMMHLSVFLLK
jgi:hypothetical protein